jgi:hypothetical protein
VGIVCYPDENIRREIRRRVTTIDVRKKERK